MDVGVPHVIQIFVDPKSCEHATYMSFKSLLTLNFVNVPYVNIMSVLGVTKPLARSSTYIVEPNQNCNWTFG
jgi:hypothetical protein